VKKQIIVAGTVAMLALGLLLSGCGEKQAQQQAAPASQAQPAPQAAQTQPQAQPAQQAAQAYPIDWCVVAGEKRGEMGPAVEYNYNGRAIKFCCKNCVKIFEKEPARYLAKLDSAAAGLIKSPAMEEHKHGTGG